ncbi:beta-aspartyl-peptidase [Jeotgalicoccus huakuii]|uniref:beta-aspartyl-peptidase n=1 Tax=Jeotgalicoccus sp. ATCC 8456 TaxID=946435 RepID=UPI0018E618C9|nr:beta-aspartyl-peptidase [Jeotgalicoccus sp. ATCC 8456]MCK1976147.1 beta-aspartyl-peptidase [Jeotgalicoccus huakuii]QQD84913.1 beta-aspartyl-peptidase [Jeotgalicoccus sp. ATCC 8456]
MLTLLKNAEVYAPEYLGQQSILLINNRIGKIGDVDEAAVKSLGVEYKIIDVKGNIVTPGFIDPHVHLLGGGGEGGFATRTPELQLSDLIQSGITSVAGLIGTDGTTRHLTSLLAKARGLEIEGVSTYIYTGNYDVPTPTITSNVKDDAILIDKVIGTAEIAIADSRSGQPNVHELAKIVGQTRVGGMLSGKAGITHFHTGPGKAYLSILHQLLDEYELPAGNLHVTHITRSKGLFDDAIRLANRGSYVDITADDETYQWVSYYKDHGGDLSKLTISSDGNGSLPKFDEEGNLLGLGVASTITLFDQVVATLKDGKLSLEETLRLVTTNTAEALKLDKKGKIVEGKDADLLVLDGESYQLQHVFAKGQHMFLNGEVLVKGTFE